MGLPQEAITLSSVIEKFPDLDNKILARIYNEKSRAIGEITSPGKVLISMDTLNKKSIEIGEEFHDHQILDMAYMNVGGANYVAKNWKYSADFLEANYKKVGTTSKIEFLRTLLLDYAYQNNYISFKKTLKRATDYIDNYDYNNPDELASLMESLARSLALFGLIRESRKILGETEKLDISPFSRSQILRCTIFIFSCESILGVKVDRDRLKDVIKQAQGNKFLPYERHRRQIQNMIENLRIYAKG
jgi:hypothetical protein